MSVPPSVSVLVTTYRHANFVREALDSLRNQTFQDFETIITDDASPDGTADVIQDWLDETGFPAHFIRNPKNRGICANRNTAVALASGRYICSLSGDDAYLPDRLARQVVQFDTLGEEFAALYSDAALMDAESHDLGRSYIEQYFGHVAPPEDVFAQILCHENFLPAPAVMIRRSALVAVGLYDESLFYEDFDMWLRLAHRFRFAYLPGIVMRYRMLSDSLSHGVATKPGMLDTEFRILARWLPQCPQFSAAISEQMWQVASRQILLGHDDLGRHSMAEIARTSPHLRRRLLARSVTLSGSGAIFRTVAAIDNWVRRPN